MDIRLTIDFPALDRLSEALQSIAHEWAAQRQTAIAAPVLAPAPVPLAPGGVHFNYAPAAAPTPKRGRPTKAELEARAAAAAAATAGKQRFWYHPESDSLFEDSHGQEECVELTESDYRARLAARESAAPAPAPVVSAPAPVVSAPAPVVSAPAPVVSAPAPVVSAPAPGAPLQGPPSHGGFIDEAAAPNLPTMIPSVTVAPRAGLTIVPDPTPNPAELTHAAVRARFVALVHKQPDKRDEILGILKKLGIKVLDEATPEHLVKIVRELPRMEREAQEFVEAEAERKLRPYREATGGVGK